ncbi:MAG: hypothetical protein AB7O24_04265 [Kofleriaceae bacterium]
MIETGVPASKARPQTFHRFTYLLGGGQLVALEQKVALIGTMFGPSGFGAAEFPHEITSPEQAYALFGVGSEITLMVRAAFATQRLIGRGPRIVAIGLEEPSGAAATYTITLGGTATESGNFRVRVAGRSYKIGVKVGDAAADVAAALELMLDRFAEELPVTADTVGSVCTLTWNHKGENGNGLRIDIDGIPKGLTAVAAAGVAGSGSVDLVAGLDALAGVDVDGIAVANHTVGDIEDLLEHITASWDAAAKRWRWAGVADTTSLASATTLAEAANDRGIVVASYEGSPSLPGEIATAVMVAGFSATRPNATFNRKRIPVYPPSLAVAYDDLEVEAGIAAGLTVLTPVTSGRSVLGNVSKIERLITTKTTQDDQPFTVLRDIGVSKTGAYYARQLDAAYERKFGPDANPDGVLLTDDADDRLADMIATIAYDMQAAHILRNVDADLGELAIEEEDEVPERFNVDLSYTVVVGLHQVAYNHRVKIGVR